MDLDALQQLIARIATGEISGPDGRQDAALTSQLLAIKDARMDARDADRQAQDGSGDDLLQAGLPAWRTIYAKGLDYLAQSPDLEVAAWITEAALRLHGFVGLAIGLELLETLVTQRWDTGLYPAVDTDGSLDDRLAPLAALNGLDRAGALVAAMKIQPLTEASDPKLAYWHYEAALALTRLTDDEARSRRIAAGTVTLEDFASAMLQEPAARLKSLHQALKSGAERYASLNRQIQTLCGDSAPPSSFIVNQFQGLLGCLESQASHVRFEEPEADAAVPDARDEAPGVDGAAPSSRPAALTRDTALARVLEIADWFEAHEPHSLAGPALREAVRRARLPLASLLSELIPSEDSRREFLMRAGLNSNRSPE